MKFIAYAVLLGVIARKAYGVPLPSEHKPFIIGGEDATEAYAPHMAALIFGDRVKSLLCGGSLISKVFVVTAAHCVEPVKSEDGTLLQTFHIRVGSNQWNSGGTIVNIKDYHMHPQWDPKNIKYDVAVLGTVEKVVLGDNVALIGMAFDDVADNENCLATGWGRTGPRIEGDVIAVGIGLNGRWGGGALEISPRALVVLKPALTPDNLQVLYMNTLAHKLCQKLMSEVSEGVAPPIQSDIEICTFHSRGHGMCLGDSGSALVRQSTRELIGIVSWGYDCARGGPDVYVRTSGVKDFFEPFLNQNDD